LVKALDLFYSTLNLPQLIEDDVEYLSGRDEIPIRAFAVKVANISLRFDASYHIPLARLAIKKLSKSKTGNIKKLHILARLFVPPRFKRVYVKNISDGVPLLQGTHISQLTPYDIKFLWQKMKNINLYIVCKNYLLLTCSGTIGRLSLVRDSWHGWAATNHLIRIIPYENEIHPGYLTAFLLSCYGKLQVERLIYGGVVDEIGEAGELMDDILILKPFDAAIEEKIGSLIYDAFDKKDEAAKLELAAINTLEIELKKLSKNTTV